MNEEARDFLGQPITVGATVIIPHSGAQKLVLGQVLSISAKQCRIQCISGHGRAVNFHSGESTTMPDITQRNHKHCAVIRTGV